MLLFVDLVTRLSQVNVIIGIVLCALGVGLALIGMKQTKAILKKEEITDENRTFVIVKAVGLVFICVGMVVMIVS